jgi:hypothetical protein
MAFHHQILCPIIVSLTQSQPPVQIEQMGSVKHISRVKVTVAAAEIFLRYAQVGITQRAVDSTGAQDTVQASDTGPFSFLETYLHGADSRLCLAGNKLEQGGERTVPDPEKGKLVRVIHLREKV